MAADPVFTQNPSEGLPATPKKPFAHFAVDEGFLVFLFGSGMGIITLFLMLGTLGISMGALVVVPIASGLVSALLSSAISWWTGRHLTTSIDILKHREQLYLAHMIMAVLGFILCLAAFGSFVAPAFSVIGCLVLGGLEPLIASVGTVVVKFLMRLLEKADFDFSDWAGRTFLFGSLLGMV